MENVKYNGKCECGYLVDDCCCRKGFERPIDEVASEKYPMPERAHYGPIEYELEVRSVTKLRIAFLSGVEYVHGKTVYHETKLTPRQLLEQRDELLAALKMCRTELATFTACFSPAGSEATPGQKLADSAISKVEGK